VSIEIEIHDRWPDGLSHIDALYSDAFPEEDLSPLVQALLRRSEDVVSFTAVSDGKTLGHAIFTLCSVVGQVSDGRVALLGPVAIAGAFQSQGIGSALIRHGLHRLTVDGADQVSVLGNPDYYGRFGFKADDRIAPPYPLPEAWHAAWQTLRLQPDRPALCGVLSVPAPWRTASLWS